MNSILRKSNKFMELVLKINPTQVTLVPDGIIILHQTQAGTH